MMSVSPFHFLLAPRHFIFLPHPSFFHICFLSNFSFLHKFLIPQVTYWWHPEAFLRVFGGAQK